VVLDLPGRSPEALRDPGPGEAPGGYRGVRETPKARSAESLQASPGLEAG